MDDLTTKNFGQFDNLVELERFFRVNGSVRVRPIRSGQILVYVRYDFFIITNLYMKWVKNQVGFIILDKYRVEFVLNTSMLNGRE